MATQGKETTYTNADGLVVGFGTRTTTNDEAVSLSYGGGVYTIEVPLNDATALADSFAGDVSHGYNIPIPAHAIITEAQFIVSTAFTSAGSAVLDIGLNTDDGDQTSTALDDDGIDSAIAVATLTADTVVLCDGVLADGTQNVGASDAYVVFTYDTAAFTAGAGVLRIKYIRPTFYTQSL